MFSNPKQKRLKSDSRRFPKRQFSPEIDQASVIVEKAILSSDP